MIKSFPSSLLPGSQFIVSGATSSKWLWATFLGDNYCRDHYRKADHNSYATEQQKAGESPQAAFAMYSGMRDICAFPVSLLGFCKSFVLFFKRWKQHDVPIRHFSICWHCAAKDITGERRSRCAVYPSDAEGFMRALSSAGAALNPSQGAGSPVSDRKVARASFQSRLRTTPTHGYSMRGTSQTEPHRAIGKVRNKLVLSRTDHQIVQKRLLSQRLGWQNWDSTEPFNQVRYQKCSNRVEDNNATFWQ